MLENPETLGFCKLLSKGSSFASYIFLFLFSFSLLGNVFLGWKVQSLRFSLTHPPANKEVRIGQHVGTLQVANLEGVKINLKHLGPHSTVLYLFSPDCHWCSRNRANLESLVKQHSSDFKFIGLSLDELHLKSYLAEDPLPFPVYIYDRQRAASELGFVGTPQTIVLSPDGEIVHNWIGVYDGLQKQHIESYFKTTLPGLLPEPIVSTSSIQQP